MAYEFKRLSDVEKLTETPEGASALAEVNGSIVRVPFGGGNANLEDMMFDLDIDISSQGKLLLTNAEQLKKMYDNNMSLHIYYSEVPSGEVHTYHDVYHCVNDNMSPTYDMYMGEAYGFMYAGSGTTKQLMLAFNQLGDSTFVPSRGHILYSDYGYTTVIKVYASVF